MVVCSVCGRDIDAIGQDNVSYTRDPLCEDCAREAAREVATAGSMNSEEARAYLTEKVREIARATGCSYVSVTLRKPSFGSFLHNGREVDCFADAWTDDSGESVFTNHISAFDKQ